MNRKSFISGIGLGTLGALTGSCMKAEPTDALMVDLPVYDPAKDAEFWRAVLQQYVLKPELHYMNTGGL